MAHTFRGSEDTPQPSQELQRTALKSALSNAIDHARMAQRVVAVLIVALARSDRLDTMLGVPTRALMDEALRRITGALRPADRLVQLSDEKVCVFLPNLRSDILPMLAANKIRQAFETPIIVDDCDVTVRPVIGIATFPAQAANANELLVHADIAEGIARSRGFVEYVFRDEDGRATDVYTGLHTTLHEAIRDNQLEVHYQPKVELKSGRCRGVEALLRWTLPDHGVIPPPAVVQLAEGNGLIGALTEWVLNTALRQQSEWKQSGILLDVAVNLSTMTLDNAELPDVISNALGTWQTEPSRLTLEITEDTTINNIDYSLGIMNQLKQLGVKLSIDDFGTGYSSLSYVKRFPLDELKIDKLFVRHMRDNKSDQRIVRSSIDLAHTFELSVVAEGVEDEPTLKELRRMGCDFAQGFAISAALPSAGLLDWLKRQK